MKDARDVIAVMHWLALCQMAGRLSETGLDADEELHRVPVITLGNQALESVLEHFGTVILRAERPRFSRDGQASFESHERLIELLASGETEQAAAVAFEIWSTLPAEDDARPSA